MLPSELQEFVDVYSLAKEASVPPSQVKNLTMYDLVCVKIGSAYKKAAQTVAQIRNGNRPN